MTQPHEKKSAELAAKAAAASIEHGARGPRGRQKAWEPIRKRQDSPVMDAAPGPPPAAAGAAKARGTKRRGEWRTPLVVGVAVGALLAFVASVHRQADPLPVVYQPLRLAEPQPDPAKRVPSVRTELAASGVPSRIEGKSPRAVLDAFCAHLRDASPTELAAAVRGEPDGAVTGDPFVAVGVRPTEPYQRNARLGVLRLSRHRSEYGIWIRHDPAAKTWFAGNGIDPIALERLASRSP